MSSTTKTTQESNPPVWTREGYDIAGRETQRLYESGSGGNPYLGSTVADLSGTTMGGVNQLANAGQNWDTSGTRSLFAGIGGASAGPSYSEQNLGQIASGQDNPHFEQALQSQLDKTAAQVRSSMSGMGRLGSGAETRALTDSLGDLRVGALSDQWNRNIANQLAASGQMDASRNAGLDRALSSAGAMYGIDQQQFNNRLQGANATLDAGRILDNQSQRQLTDEVNRYYELDNADWQRLGLLEASLAGAAGPYGTQSGTSRTSNPGALLSGIGGMFGGK